MMVTNIVGRVEAGGDLDAKYHGFRHFEQRDEAVEAAVDLVLVVIVT